MKFWSNEKTLSKFFTPVIIFSSIIFISIVVVMVIEMGDLGAFSNGIERANFLFKLFDKIFLNSIIGMSILSILSSPNNKNGNILAKYTESTIISTVLFVLNYFIALNVILPIFNVISLLIGFATGG